MVSPADETLQRAVSAMRAGQAEAAERLFKKALQSASNHLGALNLFSLFLRAADGLMRPNARSNWL
jgi:hypothetical protein